MTLLPSLLYTDGMSHPQTFAEFLPTFFDLLTKKTFKGGDFLAYLGRPAGQRTGDEASVVDMAIVSPLLGLLGFEPGDRVYNQQHQGDRPDFAPNDASFGTCFMVEDKSTALDLTLDLADPDSHLSQLSRYVRSKALRLGWLTNGRQFTVWRFEASEQPVCTIDLDVAAALAQWTSSNPPAVSEAAEKSLVDLFDLCRKEAFTTTQRLEQELALDLEEWQRQALSLGTGHNNERVLVEALQTLVKELQSEARRILAGHLTRFAEYRHKSERFSDAADAPLGAAHLAELRDKAHSILDQNFQRLLGLAPAHVEEISSVLNRLAQDPRAFANSKAVLAAVLQVVNEARRNTTTAKGKSARALTSLDEFVSLRNALQSYSDGAFVWHQRQAALRQGYRDAINVHNDYEVWASLVQETMLGDLDEEHRRDEFALQAAYVVFIRLLLIRVCEDKGIFPNRFITDGGFKHWQEDIQRYLKFANGNPYDPLLGMAYHNAQNIYAHFFTGRELFNWYTLDRPRLIMALYQLSRFNFAEVNSDIVGTVYTTYVSRKEKKKKGQYYTPPEIVNYILDGVGYVQGPAIIGSNKRLIDPACGSGTFLVSAAKRLVAAFGGAGGSGTDAKTVLEQVRNSLYGFDLNPFACYLAEVNLLIQVLDLVKAALDAGHNPKLDRFHVYNVDALAPSSGLFYNIQYDTRLAEENDQVDQIKRRAPNTPYANGFAFVVANPPYGASLSDAYKDMLRAAYPDVFYGQPDTYAFFFKLGLQFLARNGRLGFITPNTYLMGTNSAALRGQLLEAGRIEEIVDLPQGIWPDATVDCVLLFLAAESDAEKRRAQPVKVNLMDLRDSLDKLAARDWAETLTQPQKRWTDDPRHEMFIRHDDLFQRVEDACKVSLGNGSQKTVVLRLGDVTESSPGIDPYKTEAEGKANRYIKMQRDVSLHDSDWKPLLDGDSYVGRYELRWDTDRPHIKYGNWLCRPREAKFFEAPKLLVQDMRNRSLKRRLVATYDDQRFYHRKNFNNVVAEDAAYSLKYILALFNSSLLNYWFGRKFDNLHINPAYFRQLPIFPADAETQAEIVGIVDQILAKNAELNQLRAKGYTIRRKRDGTPVIEIPYDQLLRDIQAEDQNFPTLTLFQAHAAQLFSIPDKCDLQMQIGGNVFIPPKFPTTVVLRHNKLWLDVPDDKLRRFLCGSLGQPQWRGRTWDEIKNHVLVPEDDAALTAFFAREAQQVQLIQALLTDVAALDAQIDARVLDLYGITAPADRARILGSAPVVEEEDVSAETEPDSL